MYFFKVYAEFVSYLRHDPRYFSRLLRQVTFAQTEELVETLVFSLFSDVFLPDEELLLLSMIKVCHTLVGLSPSNAART